MWVGQPHFNDCYVETNYSHINVNKVWYKVGLVFVSTDRGNKFFWKSLTQKDGCYEFELYICLSVALQLLNQWTDLSADFFKRKSWIIAMALNYFMKFGLAVGDLQALCQDEVVTFRV